MATVMDRIKSFFSGGSSRSSSTTVDQPKGGRGSENLYSKPRNTALQDLQMYLGIIEKNDVYYRDLAERQERSRAAMEQAMNSSDDGPAPVPPRSPGPTPRRDDLRDAPDTVLPTEVDTPLTTVEDISVQTFTPAADFSPDVSVGQAEDEALELMKKGRRATILTKPSGLLGTGEEEGQTRRRRSLIG